jgi:hypothetical protein
MLAVSTISLMLTGFFLLLNKRFRQHPYRLMGITCLIESMLFYCTLS